MLSFLIGLIDPIGKISKVIADAYVAKQNASTDQERIHADERIKGLEYRRDVMVAEAGSKINALIRLAIAVGPIWYLLKLYIWDKSLGWGVTDPLSPMLEGIMWTVVSFYFLDHLVKRIKR